MRISPRLIIYPVCAALALLAIAVMARLLPHMAAVVFLDIDATTWPITVQNAMWIVFVIGLGEIGLRLHNTLLEEQQIRRGYLPEDAESVLRPGEDLVPIYQKVQGSQAAEGRLLPRLIERCVLNFNISGSVDQTSSLLNSSLELFQHEVDLEYNIVRYIAWLIPTLGFLGTVYGIMLALTYAGDPANAGAENLLTMVTQYLGVAFNTTLLALLQAAVIVLGQNLVQGREERALNRAGQYCLDNLINRLYPNK